MRCLRGQNLASIKSDFLSSITKVSELMSTFCIIMYNFSEPFIGNYLLPVVVQWTRACICRTILLLITHALYVGYWYQNNSYHILYCLLVLAEWTYAVMHDIFIIIMILCSVAAKHKETKQFFTMYNTLEDTKVYLEKEVSVRLSNTLLRLNN